MSKFFSNKRYEDILKEFEEEEVWEEASREPLDEQETLEEPVFAEEIVEEPVLEKQVPEDSIEDRDTEFFDLDSITEYISKKREAYIEDEEEEDEEEEEDDNNWI